MPDLPELRKQHPHWRIEAVWACASSGPDRCKFRACRAGVTVQAWTAETLTRRIAEEDRRLATRN